MSSLAPPRQRRKEARPQELLAAALALFVEKGFAGTRSEEVAQRAGVSKGTLYRYYPSKEELFKAVVRENFSTRLADFAAQAAQHAGPVRELLRHLMQAWWQGVGRGTAGGIGKVMLVEARELPELARFYRDEVITPAQQLIGSLVARGIAQGEFRAVPLDATVHLLIAPLMHLILFEHAFGACGCWEPSVAPEALLDTQLQLMLEGLLVPGLTLDVHR